MHFPTGERRSRSFLSCRLLLCLVHLAGKEAEPCKLARAKGETALKAAMASESVVQLGLLMALPMIMEIGLERGFITALEIGLERGFITALSEMIIMQLQLAAVFFTFSLGTKVSSIWFHGLYTSDWLHVVLSFILVIGFLHFIFNPSGFEWQKIVEDWDEWQKIVEDWDDWTKWISSHGGIGMPATKSWESWWAEEQEHLQYTGFMGQFREIVLSISVWSCVLFKIVFMGRKKFSADYQRMFRLLKLFLFIGFIVTLVILFLFLNLTVGDIFVNLLAFMPTGWAPLSVCSLYLSGEFGSSKSYLYASTPSSKQSFLKAKGRHSGFYLNNSYRICTLPLRSGMLISSTPLSMDFERTKRRLGGKETKPLNLHLSSSSRRERES
ncbi:hypothetical protein V6N13_144041 [Hibiscus sabdariffa]